MASREHIYYWKCDRPSAFFAIKGDNGISHIMKGIEEALTDYFGGPDFKLFPAKGQGNHLIFIAAHGGVNYFVRIENGPERDEYMAVEAMLMDMVRPLGVPTPHIYAVDAWHVRYPFAWQLMEMVPYPDLNCLYKAGTLESHSIMHQLGRYIALWQQIEATGYGPYDTNRLHLDGQLVGLLPAYRDYYVLNMERHLNFLVQSKFMDAGQAREVSALVKTNDCYLDIPQGCLVHKDIALWNLLGDHNTIRSVIDWDDAVLGDPTDDLSLIGCFHSGDEIRALVNGYTGVKPLPQAFEPRFWLHLLRNMIFKAVIRVGAGYFEKGNDFFLINSSEGGESLRLTTLNRITAACDGLRGSKNIFEL